VSASRSKRSSGDDLFFVLGVAGEVFADRTVVGAVALAA
jgi:hypothetical protein